MENSALAEGREASDNVARPTGLPVIGLIVTVLSVAMTSLFFLWQGSVESQIIRLALIAAATLAVFLSLDDLVHEKQDTLSHWQRVVAFCRYTAILTVVSFTLLGHLDGISYLSCILSSAFVAMLLVVKLRGISKTYSSSAFSSRAPKYTMTETRCLLIAIMAGVIFIPLALSDTKWNSEDYIWLIGVLLVPSQPVIVSKSLPWFNAPAKLDRVFWWCSIVSFQGAGLLILLPRWL